MYSIEFRILPEKKSPNLRFLESQCLVVIDIAKLPRNVPGVTGKLTLFAQLQSSISVKHQIISCGRCSADISKAPYQNPDRLGGSQYPFTSELVDVGKFVCGPSNDAWGSIDMFSLLKTQLGRLNGTLFEKWMHV